MALDSKFQMVRFRTNGYKNHINLVNPANKRNLDVIVVGTGLEVLLPQH
jgi:succinate dehydrogenase / fumarate reductase flavoprotein subunit